MWLTPKCCSPACRVRGHRARQRAEQTPLAVEVDFGSASSKGRPPERAWMIRLRRDERSVIVAIGLRHPVADRLAARIADLLGAPARAGDKSSREPERRDHVAGLAPLGLASSGSDPEVSPTTH